MDDSGGIGERERREGRWMEGKGKEGKGRRRGGLEKLGETHIENYLGHRI